MVVVEKKKAEPVALSALSGADILGGSDGTEVIAVDVPEWNGRVHLRSLAAEESIMLSDALQRERTKAGDKAGEGILYVVGVCLCDADGKRVISDEQIPLLRKKSMKVLGRLQDIALKLNGMLADEDGTMEALKNASGGAATAASSSS